MRIAALVLAAGRSRRFGARNKLLADLEGRAVLARTVAAVTAAEFDETMVVTGPDHDAIEQVLREAPVRLVRCANERDGIGLSIATGIVALRSDLEGVAILPGDMPLMTTATLRKIADEFVSHQGQRIVHAADGQGAQRNPVLWPRIFFSELMSLQGDRGAKIMIRDAVTVRVTDDRELLDIDDEEGFARARQALIGKLAQS
jgi:molybdenum cofactor cytidylyltransferase